MKPAVVHRERLTQTVPTDLFHAVIQLVRVTVGIVEVGVPIGARHVAPAALNLHAALVLPFAALHDFFETADLPRDLIHYDLRLEAPLRVEKLAHLAVEEHEAMMVGAVAHEVPARIPHAGDVGRVLRTRSKIEPIGDAVAQILGVEFQARFHLERVEPEVADAAHLERPFEQHAANIVRCRARFDHARALPIISVRRLQTTDRRSRSSPASTE